MCTWLSAGGNYQVNPKGSLFCETNGPIPFKTTKSTSWKDKKAKELFISAAAAKSLQSCLTLWDPRDSSPPGSPLPGILHARTLEWVATAFSNAWKWKVKVKLLSHVQLSDPMDYSPPGSSVHGIFQARGLEWGAIAFSDSSVLNFLIISCRDNVLLLSMLCRLKCHDLQKTCRERAEY